jgi:hypothetical protein
VVSKRCRTVRRYRRILCAVGKMDFHLDHRLPEVDRHSDRGSHNPAIFLNREGSRVDPYLLSRSNARVAPAGS